MCYADRMFDTLAVAQQLAAGGVNRDQAEVIANAIRLGVEEGGHVTSDQFKAGLADLKVEISRVEADLKADMKLLKFGYGPIILGLLIKLAFFP